MIEVKILAANWGDLNGQMTVPAFQTVFKKMSERASWAIFAEDTAQPGGARRISPSEVTDGMKVSVTPQLAGG